jgi:hypothetical protein
MHRQGTMTYAIPGREAGVVIFKEKDQVRVNDDTSESFTA